MQHDEMRDKMKAGYLVDPDTDLANKVYAVVTAGARARNRFPENVVSVMQDPESALAAADPAAKRRAALVYGPCRSSEGLRLYYLVEWLDA